MKVIASNIANAQITRTPSGEPYRRQEAIFSSRMGGLSGVKFDRIVADMKTEFKRVFQPGHPDANTEGFLRLPNVELPQEMMGMVMASRAYQANAAVLKRYQEAMNLTLELLR